MYSYIHTRNEDGNSMFNVSEFNADPEGPIVFVVFDNKCLISVRHVDDSNHSLMLQSPICIVAVGAFRQHLEFTYSIIMKLFYCGLILLQIRFLRLT